MRFGSYFSDTKKLFKESIESLKSFVSGGCTKLIPTSPPCQFCTLNPFSCTRGGDDTKFRHSYRELDNFYADYMSKQWHHAINTEESVAANEINMNNQLQATTYPTITTVKPENELDLDDSSTNVIAGKNYHERKIKRSTRYERKSGKEEEVPIGRAGGTQDQREERRTRVVAEKLRELETMDGGNMEHVLDIEEVIHYYSRLTCPAYRRIIDKFFMEMYTEFSN